MCTISTNSGALQERVLFTAINILTTDPTNSNAIANKGFIQANTLSPSQSLSYQPLDKDT